MKTIILAGGKGERLKPLTDKIPKPMVLLKEKPIIWYIIQQLKFYDIKNINVAIGFKGQVIKEYFKTNFLDLNIKLFDNGNVDIIERIKSIVKNDYSEDVLVLYGDTISDVKVDNLLSFHKLHTEFSTLTVWPLKTNFGIVEIDKNNCIYEFKEKPNLDKYINVGYFLLRKEMLKYLNDFKSYAEFLIFCGSKGLLKAFIHDGEHYTVNNIVELKEAENNLNKINIY